MAAVSERRFPPRSPHQIGVTPSGNFRAPFREPFRNRSGTFSEVLGATKTQIANILK